MTHMYTKVLSEEEQTSQGTGMLQDNEARRARIMVPPNSQTPPFPPPRKLAAGEGESAVCLTQTVPDGRGGR